MTPERDLLATLDEYADAYCAKDIDRLMRLFDEGDDVSVIGTGEDELCSGRAEIQDLFRRNFAEATAHTFDWHWTQVTVRRDTGVIAASLTIHLDIDDQPMQVPVRWTVALSRRDDRWVWLHRHASSAAGSQRAGTAYPTNQPTDNP